MTIESMTRSHQVDIHALTSTTDAAKATTKAVGAAVSSSVYCRKLTLSSKEVADYQRKGITTDTIFQFATDPGMDQDKIIKHGGKYYQFAGVEDMSDLGLLFVVLTKHIEGIDS